MLFVLILTLIFWVPGTLAAFFMTIDHNEKRGR
jgi:uncharacterized membrane protein YqaE (UPF0057 family)